MRERSGGGGARWRDARTRARSGMGRLMPRGLCTTTEVRSPLCACLICGTDWSAHVLSRVRARYAHVCLCPRCSVCSLCPLSPFGLCNVRMAARRYGGRERAPRRATNQSLSHLCTFAECEELMMQAARSLNLKKHIVGHGAGARIMCGHGARSICAAAPGHGGPCGRYGPADIELHRSHDDGRVYCLDVVRARVRALLLCLSLVCVSNVESRVYWGSIDLRVFARSRDSFPPSRRRGTPCPAQC